MLEMLPMLLTIDIGNTSIAFGCFRGKKLIRHWRLPTNDATLNKLRKSLSKNILNPPSPPFNKGGRGGFEGACISSVVPSINSMIRKTLRNLFGCPLLFVTAKNAGIKIIHYNPKEVGADRLVNAIAAYRRYNRSLIIVDFGTATTFDYVTPRGEYAGGAIAPGIEISNRALSQMTAKLPKVEIKKTNRIVGRKTKESMQSGIFHGYVGLVDHLVKEMTKEVRTKPKVIATGGLAPLIAKSTKTIESVTPFLTLEGLKIIWQRCRASDARHLIIKPHKSDAGTSHSDSA